MVYALSLYPKGKACHWVKTVSAFLLSLLSMIYGLMKNYIDSVGNMYLVQLLKLVIWKY